jgi:hypothetical protein
VGVADEAYCSVFTHPGSRNRGESFCVRMLHKGVCVQLRLFLWTVAQISANASIGELNGVYTLFGVVHGGNGCGQPDYPGVWRRERSTNTAR